MSNTSTWNGLDVGWSDLYSATEKVLVKNADKEIRLHRIYTFAANVNINRLVRKKGKKSLVGAFQLSHCNDVEENSDFNQNSPL
ncbi:MAG TPA: hypothetical protein VKA09_02410 [Nitrososphaeraceae archaeon]|nr:hypothetical protein [Nitrososphaeraceae archaeon]